ncbi:MAG: amino acid permease [Thermonemataceae bacterium]|nr:amino acid permease [Thermonemataceae bacterium]
MQSSQKVSFNTAIAIVVANMIGAGVFTSLGYQAVSTPYAFPLLALWFIGGIIALSGALSYGELASMMPRSGGEYNYLSHIYHPMFGFLSGWISATIGFAAPVALAAVALGTYASNVIGVDAKLIGTGVVLVITAIHATDTKAGGSFQRYSTAVKLGLIFLFILSGIFLNDSPQNLEVIPSEKDWKAILEKGFAVSLAFVSFAYSGWNASAYLANEIENPQKNVPKSLLMGTLVVMAAYILLNFIFLYTIPISTLASEQAQDFSKPLEVGYLSAKVIFGKFGGKIMASLIALLLVSSISSMVFAGPRVTQMIGEDFPLFKRLAKTNAKGVPSTAILAQSFISIILIFTSSFESILFAIAFILDVFTFSTVLGVFILRIKKPKAERKYKTWGYPLTPFIFLVATGWTMWFLFQERIFPATKAAFAINLNPEKPYLEQSMPFFITIGMLISGSIIYLLSKNSTKK